MKKIFYTLCLLLWALCPGTASAQNSSYCYRQTRKLLEPRDNGTAVTDVKFYNALGKVSQQLLKGYTPQQRNLITCTDFDGMGRLSRQWLPVYSPKGYLASTDLKSLASSQYGGDSYSYERWSYDKAPLPRPVMTYAPGTAWRSNPTTAYQLSNGTSRTLVCKHYEVDMSGTLKCVADYPAHNLRVTERTDEDGHRVYEFQDVDGQTVLVRRISDNVHYDTYYVYDALRRLCFVLQPGYQDSGDLSLHAFCYTYDEHGRCISQKMPGRDVVCYTYDSNDLLLFSQDGEQREAGRQTFYLYDRMYRLAVQGECDLLPDSTDTDLASICTYAGAGQGLSGCGYSSVLDLPSPVLRQVNYYDSYGFLSDSGFPSEHFPAPVGEEYGCGKLTGCLTSIDGQDVLLCMAYYYSSCGDLIREVTGNVLGGYDRTETLYSFTHRPLEMTHTHTVPGAASLTEVCHYTYDHADRLVSVEHTLDGVKQTLLRHTYDELCRLWHTDYHGTSAHRQTYLYNIRGWLAGISGSGFSQQLHYTDGPGVPCYNGNISSMTWQTSGEDSVRGYKFVYDDIDRLVSASYGEGNGLSDNVDGFTEKVSGYDLNGNILSLQRYGQLSSGGYGLLDDLTYTLYGNQLRRVDDAATGIASAGGFEFKDAVKQADEYAYDKNGNLTKDLNRNIVDIQYNFLNLPCKVVFAGGDSITYVYAADGTKLRSTATVGGVTTTTDYCGNVIYENGVRKLLLTEAGYITLKDGKYHYYLQDHQGNNRVVVDEDGTVEEVNHYYPFGGLFASSGSIQPYKYNGKELESPLQWYDYGARRYDAVLGRFTTVDPSAESYYDTAPYAYCGNNPVTRIDPSGADWIQDRYGSYLWDNTATSQESTRYGWTYVGAELPDDVNPYRILEEVNGQLYHKHTGNPLASLINSLLGESVFVEKKAYAPSDDLMMQELVESTGELALGSAFGKAVGHVAGKLGGEGFESFAAFKKAKGAAGDGMAWHHIVEQHADNVTRFGAQKIHNTKNLIRLPNGKGSIHAKVSGHYSSIMRDKNIRVRDYVKTLSFEEQYKYGINVLKQFGWKP